MLSYKVVDAGKVAPADAGKPAAADVGRPIDPAPSAGAVEGTVEHASGSKGAKDGGAKEADSIETPEDAAKLLEEVKSLRSYREWAAERIRWGTGSPSVTVREARAASDVPSPGSARSGAARACICDTLGPQCAAQPGHDPGASSGGGAEAAAGAGARD